MVLFYISQIINMFTIKEGESVADYLTHKSDWPLIQQVNRWDNTMILTILMLGYFYIN